MLLLLILLAESYITCVQFNLIVKDKNNLREKEREKLSKNVAKGEATKF
jgi:hypothetical protein